MDIDQLSIARLMCKATTTVETSTHGDYYGSMPDSEKASDGFSSLLRIARSQNVWFWTTTVAFICAYFAMQVIYVERVPLIMDEFDGAYDVFRLRDQIPYRDLSPYKTVLGYYIQLIPLLVGKSIWQGLINVKITMALINALCILVSVILLARIWSRVAIVLALPMWLSMSEWLERSSDLRVDTMTGLAGFFSLIALLRSRPFLSGVLAGLSFLISQKGIYYGVSAIMGLCALSLFRGSWRASLGEFRRFVLGGAAVLLPYLSIFTLLASAETIARTTFMSHTTIAFKSIYPNMRRFWWLSIERNPGFYAFVVLGLLVLLVNAYVTRRWRYTNWGESGGRVRADRILCGYALALSALGVWHKQPWPYFFVLLIPTGFVVIVAGFDRALDWSAKFKTTAFFSSPVKLLAVLVLLSLVPQSVRATTRLKEDSRYQASVVELASKLVSQGQHYFAGVDLLYNRVQSSPLLRRYSHNKRKRLRKADNEEVEQALRELRLNPPIILVYNYRFRHLPRKVKKYLKKRYEPYWGSIDIYSPAFRRGSQMLYLDFPGRYEVSLRGRGPARIGKRIAYSGDQLVLSRGYLRIRSAYTGRLQLQFEGVESLRNSRFKHRRPFFEPEIYER